MSPATKMIGEKDLARLPYFAILALGARGARLVEPLLDTWRQAEDEPVRAVSDVLQVVEDLAASPDATARTALWPAAVLAGRRAAEAAAEADRAEAPQAALHVADAAAELSEAVDERRPRRTAARAVRRSLCASARAAEHAGSKHRVQFLRRLELDAEKLRLQAFVEGWTDETGVPLRVLQ